MVSRKATAGGVVCLAIGLETYAGMRLGRCGNGQLSAAQPDCEFQTLFSLRDGQRSLVGHGCAAENEDSTLLVAYCRPAGRVGGAQQQSTRRLGSGFFVLEDMGHP